MHQLRDKRKITKRKNIIRNFIIVGILSLLAITGILYKSGKLFNLIGLPIWKTQNIVTETAHNSSYVLRTKAYVFAENEKIKEENINMKNQMIDYEILKSENDQLKELLNRIPSDHNLILATILAKPNRSPYDTIIVDAGSDVGVREGLSVFANGNIPIGKVGKVYNSTSIVMLYSNPGQITEAVIDGSNASVEIVGRGGGNFEMTIPLDLSAESGKLIILPNTTSEVVAIVDRLISNPTDPIKKVLLRSPVNIQNLKWVQIKRD